MNKREVLRFLAGIEEGGIDIDDCYQMLMRFDPLLAYFILRYLREKHPITPENSGPGERLMKLLANHQDAQGLAKGPKGDSFVEWFDETYSTRDFFNSPESFVDTIIEKLEG